MAAEVIEPRGRSPRIGRILIWLALGIPLGALAITAGANIIVRQSARRFLHTSPSEVAAPIAIVPGASVRRDGTPSPQLEDRLMAALILLREGRVERVLVSGARDGAYDEAGPMRRWLIQRGTPGAKVLEDHAGYRTLDTMERAAHVFGVHRAVVCTQAFHLPRAVFLARRAGIDATGLAIDESRGPSDTTVREALANLMAVIDTFVLRRQPRERGAPIRNDSTTSP